MQKQTSIYIPKPCHEDWNKMTPTQQGKFCASCNKQVVDFSVMSDNQILNFLSTQPGKLCGRFDAEQLQRPLIETKIKKKRSWWMAFTMPLLFLFERSEAQENIAMIKADTTVAPAFKQPDVMGKIAYQPMKQITVSGKVVDERNEPISFATIIEKGTKNAVVSDGNGLFTISIKNNQSDVALTSSAVGFEAAEQKINYQQDSVTIVMKMSESLLGDVVITTGLMNTCHRIKTIDTLHSTARKLFRTNILKVYPNPAVNNGIINLEIKQAGTYQMQLLDDESRLIMVEEINTDSDKSTMQIQLPSNIASGIYYLRLIDEQKKKSYTEKLIVQ